MNSTQWARVAMALTMMSLGAFAWAVLDRESRVGPFAVAALVLCVISFSIWFLLTFTGDPKDKLDGMFLFAYVFTFVCFALLALPPASRDVTSDRSPIALIRGCAVEGTQDVGLIPYPTSMMCAVPGTRTAIAPTAQLSTDGPSEVKLSALDATVSQVGAQRFWLLAVGGVSGQRMPIGCGLAPANECEYMRVSSGLAVPLYVIILAFVGGAVSLSRRIPEYQKRSHPNFGGTQSESKLSEVDAREAVVFQIMQLISAPFIALSAYYIVGPSTLATGVGLAFACGFASEPILLMIRGIITGIRPEGTRLKSSSGCVITGTVIADGQAVAQASLSVDGLPEVTALTNSAGQFTIANMAPGEYRLRAKSREKVGTASVDLTRVREASIVIQLT